MNDTLFEQLRELAKKQGQTVLFLQCGKIGQPIFLEGKPDLIICNVRDPDLYGKMDSLHVLETPHVHEQVRSFALAMLKEGVELRKTGRLVEAYASYRLALYIAVHGTDPHPTSVMALNVWVAREMIRDVLERGGGPTRHELPSEAASRLRDELKRTCEQMRADADAVCRIAETSSALQDAQTRHRLAQIAADDRRSRHELEVLYSSRTAPSGAERLLIACIEEIAQSDLEEVLLMDERAEPSRLKEVWSTYLALRGETLPENKRDWLTALHFAIDHLQAFRLRSTAGGGTFGHRISYRVSSMIQPLGRDLARAYFSIGSFSAALEAAEHTHVRAMVDWMVRTRQVDLARMPRPFLAAVAPFTGSWNAIQAPTLDEIISAPAARKAPILEYLWMGSEYLVWLIEPDGTIVSGETRDASNAIAHLFHALPMSDDITALKRSTASLRDARMEQAAEDGEGALRQHLRQGYEAIIPAPIRERLSSYQQVAIVTDGDLDHIPFAALISEANVHWIEQIEIVYWPSICAWLLLNETCIDREAHEPRQNVLVGVSSFPNDVQIEIDGQEHRFHFGDLRGAREEVEGIAAMLRSEPLLDSERTRQAILSSDFQTSIIHIATHGVALASDPERSFLVLPKDHLLAAEIYDGASIKADLVIMSACQTGLGGAHPDSRIGLANAFLIAGAQTVVSTLWSIQDLATARLMRSFYEGLLAGKTPAASLRGAQLRMLAMESSQHLQFWAAFKVVGHGGAVFG